MNRRLTSMMITTATLLSAGAATYAQEDYRFDVGGGIGMTGYLGDANTSNLWSHPSWDAEILFRYIFNPRWALKTNFYVGGLSGDSSDMTNVFPDDKTYRFTTSFYEIGEMAEFSFFNYGIGETYRQLKKFTPYITGGVGGVMWSAGGETSGAFVLPFGVGIKFKPRKRLNLGVEFLMKKVFSDRLDGKNLDDPMGIESSFIKNTDWYSTLTFTLSYEFSKRCATCNYKD